MTNQISPSDQLILDVKRFMHAVDQTTDQFNARQAAFYTGMQLEELAKKMGVILGMDQPFVIQMDQIGKDFKKGAFDGSVKMAANKDLEQDQRHKLLDTDFDLAWVSVAAALSLHVDAHGGFAEGARSNIEKINPDGKVIKDENGKVQKPEGWTPPDFMRFVFPI